MRKDLQLCAQVARAIEVHWFEIDDDALLGVYLLEVTPAPDATRLRVVLELDPGRDGGAALAARIAAARAAIARHERRLRAAVAVAITRKRAPELCCFLVVARPGGGA